jgi:hypothetical protein
LFCVLQLPDIRAFGGYDRLQRRRSTFRLGSLKKKTPTPKTFESARSSDIASGAEARRGRPSSCSVEENSHLPSLIAKCRKFGKVWRWVFRVSTGMQIKRREASCAP